MKPFTYNLEKYKFDINIIYVLLKGGNPIRIFKKSNLFCIKC